jgi:hypothetical protein
MGTSVRRALRRAALDAWLARAEEIIATGSTGRPPVGANRPEGADADVDETVDRSDAVA